MKPKTKLAEKTRRDCPRCGSYRTYSADEEFICMACSYIVVKPV